MVREVGNGCPVVEASKCFAEHFHLQISRKFFIGQSPSALALFVVPGTKIPAYRFRCSLLHIA